MKFSHFSETLIIPPPPPTPFYKIEERFVFDKAGPVDKYNLYFVAFMILGAGKANILDLLQTFLVRA